MDKDSLSLSGASVAAFQELFEFVVAGALVLERAEFLVGVGESWRFASGGIPTLENGSGFASCAEYFWRDGTQFKSIFIGIPLWRISEDRPVVMWTPVEVSYS